MGRRDTVASGIFRRAWRLGLSAMRSDATSACSRAHKRGPVTCATAISPRSAAPRLRTDPVRRSCGDAGPTGSAAEEEVEQDREHHREDDRGRQRDVDAHVAAAEAQVTGQPAQPEPVGAQQQRPDEGDEHAEDEQHPADVTEVHGPSLPRLLPSTAPVARTAGPSLARTAELLPPSRNKPDGNVVKTSESEALRIWIGNG